MDQRFRPYERLRKKEEIRNVLRQPGTRGEFCIVHITPNAKPYSRLGIVASRKIGNAVKRNRVKRMFREVYRHIKNQLVENVDVVVRAKPNAPHAGYHRLRRDIAGALQAQNLLKVGSNDPFPT